MPLIQVFAKPPVNGKVKTRLIPDIGIENATAVYRHCLNQTLDLINASPYQYEIWLGEASNDPIFKQQFQLQQGENLGDRMYHALAQGLNNNIGGSVILVGSDCLDLQLQHLNETAEALERYDLVLLPCFDGGFALIGCRKTDPLLFNSIEWSSEKVLTQILNNAETLKYSVHLLETVRDIDTLADLNYYPALLALIPDD